jgi:hypothetical protein
VSYRTVTEEDSGLLGDLPRTRPGRRSAKRSTPAARPSPASARPRAAEAAPPPAEERPGEAELVIGAARAVAGVARAGLQTASRVAGGVFGRIPRP